MSILILYILENWFGGGDYKAIFTVYQARTMYLVF